MNKRLEMLETLTSKGQADSFTWYALALEYKKLDRSEEALSVFTQLRARDPEYLPMYLMAGQLLVESERLEEASEWLKRGQALAERKGDSKAFSEIGTLLASIG
jgi:tetratricopeptide (TPR) repeat protein